MLVRTLLLAIVGTASGFASAPIQPDCASKSGGKGNAPTWLFTVDGKITGGQGELHIHDVSKAIMFTDRPNRYAKQITVSELTDYVTTMAITEKDPPNAVVSGTNSAGQAFNAVLEITAAASQDNKIVFHVKSVGQMDDEAVQMDTMGQCVGCEASIFIDSFGSGTSKRGCSNSIWKGPWCAEGYECQECNYVSPCYRSTGSYSGWVADKSCYTGGYCVYGSSNNDFDTTNRDKIQHMSSSDKKDWECQYIKDNCPGSQAEEFYYCP